MRIFRISPPIPLLAGIAALLVLPLPAAATAGRAGEYVTSERCAPCHQTAYKGWVNTFHSTVIRDARKDPSAILADMSDPDLPFKREEIWFTIGGHWDQRYLTKIGDDFYILPRLWSVQSKKWRPYSTYGWQKRPYSRYCVGCHSVGFDPATKEIVEHAIGCESCHGPGAGHVASPEAANIVNPARLPKDRNEEVCAACHVRGKDLTGEFYFPIGYRPGEELAKYLVPLEKNEGESDHDAIHRLWDKWRADREAQARSRCEVCGIHQDAKPKGNRSGSSEACMTCHEFDEKQLAGHTHHPAGAPIGCTDCHVQKPESDDRKELEKEKNVHSYGYFLIHRQNCWDKEIHRRCGKCHGDRPGQWAYDTFNSWRKPEMVDH